MTIALSRAPKFSGARYTIIGELSSNATWSQTLELVADDSTVSISGQTVEITFKEYPDDDNAILTVSSTASQITITDADTLTIIVTDEVMSALLLMRYTVDLKSTLNGVVTHWATGSVVVRQAPPT